MDFTKILKRAWHIVWNYRILWVFGFILAVTTSGGSGGGGNNGSRFNFNENNRENFRMPSNMQGEFENAGEAFEYFKEYGIPQLERQLQLEQGDLTTIFWIVIAFFFVMVLFGFVMAAIRYATETSVIRMVDEYDATETKVPFREGWRMGWNRRAWKLFLINLIINIPTVLLLGFIALLGFAAYQTAITTGGSDAIWVGLVGIIALIISVLLIFAILMAFLNLLRQFFWREAALQELGVRDSFSEGWQLFKENWKNIGIMWLIMVGIGFAWGIASIFLALLTLPLVAITLIAAAIVVIIPTALLAAFFSLFLSGYLPWIAGGLFVLPLFFTLAFSPWVFLGGIWQLYTSTIWTLVYREITIPPDAPQADEAEVLTLDA